MLYFDIGGTGGRIECFDPGGVGREWSRFDFTDCHVPEPGVDVLTAEMINVGMAGDFDVVFCLCNVNAIVHV